MANAEEPSPVESAYAAGGSSHPGGVQAVFGDGAVHFVRDNVDPDVLRRLAARNDGERVDLDEYSPSE
jgi:Protein of unknown function (DUF1559)